MRKKHQNIFQYQNILFLQICIIQFLIPTFKKCYNCYSVDFLLIQSYVLLLINY